MKEGIARRLTAVADGAYHMLQWVDRTHRVARFSKKSSKTFMRCNHKVSDQAIHMAKARSVDIVCCGHIHLPEEHHDLATGNLYFNSGSWVELPCTFLAVREGLVELRRFDADCGKGSLARPIAPKGGRAMHSVLAEV